MSQEAPVRSVTKRLIKRLGLLAVLLGGLFLYFGQADDASRHHRIGTSYLAYDQRARCVLTTDRPIVLDSGMQDGRGVAFAWHQGNPLLYVADAWEGVTSFEVKVKESVPNFGRKSPPPRTALARAPERCPEGQCVEIEYGGLSARENQLLLSDAHRQQLLVLTQPDGAFKKSIGGPLRGVKDAAWLPDGRMFVADSNPDADERTSGTPTGKVYVFNGDKPEDSPVADNLRRPVGVAVSATTERVYVADLEAASEVWSYYRKGEKGWFKAGTLWRQALGPYRPAIRLQGMVLADYDPAVMNPQDPLNKECVSAPPDPSSQEVVVAAGPDGLYFFHSHGALLAKYFLGRPVAGVTWGPDYEDKYQQHFNWLYFTSGRQIGALKTRLRQQAVVIAPATPASGSR